MPKQPDSGNEKEIDRLTKAIVEAIMNSQPVRLALSKMTAPEVHGNDSFMVLMLRVKSMLDLNSEIESKEKISKARKGAKPANRRSKSPASSEGATAQKKRSGSSKPQLPVVDGEVLSGNGIAFLEYLQKDFNEKDWLKKNRIKF